MMKGGMCTIHSIAWILVIVGALNWGLVGIADLNVVSTIFGSWPMVLRVVYILVGAAGVLMLIPNKKCCGEMGMEKKMP